MARVEEQKAAAVNLLGSNLSSQLQGSPPGKLHKKNVLSGYIVGVK